MADRQVLVTGANSGIGLATLLELARRGFRAVGSVRSAAKAEVVERAASDADVDVSTVLLDVTDAAQCRDVIGGLDLWGLVNNAGYALTGAVEDVDDDEAHALFETMVHAPVRLARLALPAMRARGDGRIVNVGSIMGRVSMPFGGHYTAAKHAIEALTDALRVEVASEGIRVILVEPGGFRTGIWEEYERDIARRDEQGSRFVGAYRRALQMQHLAEPLMGEPERCAAVIVSALEARIPRSRYLVGLDAQAANLAYSLTPTFIKDRVYRLSLGL